MSIDQMNIILTKNYIDPSFTQLPLNTIIISERTKIKYALIVHVLCL